MPNPSIPFSWCARRSEILCKLFVGEFFFRYITPLECERLQGFPDNWTEQGTYSVGDMVWNGEIKINAAGQNAPHMVFLKEEKTCKLLDSERYKLCGNAVTTKVVEYIIKQLYKNLI